MTSCFYQILYILYFGPVCPPCPAVTPTLGTPHMAPQTGIWEKSATRRKKLPVYNQLEVMADILHQLNTFKPRVSDVTSHTRL